MYLCMVSLVSVLLGKMTFTQFIFALLMKTVQFVCAVISKFNVLGYCISQRQTMFT